MKLAKVFFAGLIISFLGSLPLGTLNVAALQLSVSDGYRPACWFVLGITVVEMIYVRLSLVMIDRIMRHSAVLKALKWVSLTIIVALAANAFIAAARHDLHVRNILVHPGISPFFTGMLLMSVNPVQIPFWFGWNTVLYSRNILLPRPAHYNIYPIGIGIGSLIGSAVFIFGGQVLITVLKDRQDILNWILGALFTLFALIQLRKIVRGKKAGAATG